MTPQQRAQWFEHNVFYALQASDEYAWLYSEKMNWWTNTDLPAGIRQAVIDARDKVRNGQKLDFDIDALMKTARDARTEAIAAKAGATQCDRAQNHAGAGAENRRRARRRGLSNFETAAGFRRLIRFFCCASRDDFLDGLRQRQPLCRDALHRAETKDLTIVGENRDDGVWNGDSVEVSLSGAPENGAPLARDAAYFHFIINPRGVLWDAKARGESNDISFNTHAKSAAQIGANEWTVEVAIPWKDLGMTAPQTGAKLSLNLARVRVAGQAATYSSWSQFVGGFQETENFGTVTLG